MKTKLSKTTSTGKEVWLEITNIEEVVSSGISVAICEWKVIDSTGSIIIPFDGVQTVHGCLTPALYSQWDKTEESYAALFLQTLNSIETYISTV